MENLIMSRKIRVLKALKHKKLTQRQAADQLNLSRKHINYCNTYIFINIINACIYVICFNNVNFLRKILPLALIISFNKLPKYCQNT